ncbi:MAG: SdpI family protein [Chitinivibrionales bacterium]|nr:SdpI family protein [Chitinivibrionales bacterium]
MSYTMPLMLLVASLLIVGLSIPLIKGSISRNDFYGFRTPKTMSNDQIWFKANRFAGEALLWAGIISSILLIVLVVYGFKNPEKDLTCLSLLSLTGPLLIAILVSFAYLKKH